MKAEIRKRPVKSIGEKFDFANQVFSNPRHRTKQKASPLTPIRAAVTCKVAQYFNLDRGYSFVSERRMAEEIGCSQPSVNNALKWLESEGHIKRVDERKANAVIWVLSSVQMPPKTYTRPSGILNGHRSLV